MSLFRAVAWDIDGTLIDSEPLHERALADASAALGADLSDLAPDAFRGVHARDIWRWDPLESTCRHASLSIL